MDGEGQEGNPLNMAWMAVGLGLLAAVCVLTDIINAMKG